MLRMVTRVAVILMAVTLDCLGVALLKAFAVLLFCLGGLVNGSTIAMLSYLMEISPDDRRPAYSGYFNTMVAPTSLLPIEGVGIADTVSLHAVFWVAVVAGAFQYWAVRRLRRPTGHAG